MKLTPIGSNQTELRLADGTVILFSYSTPVACLKDGQYYRTAEHHSPTTSKHINRWLGNARHGTAMKSQAWFNTLVGN